MPQNYPNFETILADVDYLEVNLALEFVDIKGLWHRRVHSLISCERFGSATDLF